MQRREVILGRSVELRLWTGSEMLISGTTKKIFYDKEKHAHGAVIANSCQHFSGDTFEIRLKTGETVCISCGYLIYEENQEISTGKCECGSFRTYGALNGQMHSSWCPWYTK